MRCPLPRFASHCVLRFARPRPPSLCERGVSPLFRNGDSREWASVASSAYSMSVPEGRPRARRVTLMPAGPMALWRYMAVASPSRLVLVATMTSDHCLIGRCRLGGVGGVL